MSDRRSLNDPIRLFMLTLVLLFTHLACVIAEEPTSKRPNILWITSEDTGPQLGCYGDTYATTPNLDRLATKSLRFLNCWSNAPVCAPARTTIITGMWPTSTGSQNMRSEVRLPNDVTLFPQLLREAGYYCSNNAKEDYNLIQKERIWDESSNKAHWRKRKEGQPFFAVFNSTVSHESQIRKRPHRAKHDSSKVNVPPYHPDLPEVRRDWAQYYDKVEEMDSQLGEILDQLEADGLTDSTIIFYFGDHGSGMPRSKRWLYQSGLHVPLLIHVPSVFQHLVKDQFQAGSTNEDLVGFVDLAPTVLSLAGVEIPKYLQGRAILGPHRSHPPEFMVGFRDRMDERYDSSRAVRDSNFHYIRNWLPHRPQGQFIDYMFETPTTQVWYNAFLNGKTNEAQSAFWKTKAPEELYDLKQDPHQIRNLAADPAYAEVLQRMRSRLRDWSITTADLGLMHEADVYRLSRDSSPREVGLRREQFPVDEIYDAADQAMRLSLERPELLVPLLRDARREIRYWGFQGLLYQAVLGKSIDPVMARAGLNDESPINQALAAETLARYGSEEDRQVGIELLKKIVIDDATSLFDKLQATNGLDFLEIKTPEMKDFLARVQAKDTRQPPRYQAYLGDMLKRLQSHISK
jgi:arylsulfatase A-like enzyme